MDYKNRRSNLLNIIIIIVTLFIIQFIFLDTYIKKSFVDDVITSAFYTQENNDIKMIERYFDLYHEDMNKPVLLSVYSFVYSTVGLNGTTIKGGNVPLVLAYEPRYNWSYDERLDIPIINVEKNNNIYVIPEGGEHIKKLLRGELLEIKLEDVNKDRMGNNSKLKKIIAIPIISEYKLNGFIILGWEKKFKNDKEFVRAVQKFSDDIKPYINYKSIHQSDIININKGSEVITFQKEN